MLSGLLLMCGAANQARWYAGAAVIGAEMNWKWALRRILIGIPLFFSLFVILVVTAEFAASWAPYGGYLVCLVLVVPFIAALLEEWIWPLEGDP